jgi:hypothetical protein
MAAELAIWRDGDKYMWDGASYATRDEAEAKAEAYAGDDFETQVIESEGAFLVYSRRVVTEIVLEGEAPL